MRKFRKRARTIIIAGISLLVFYALASGPGRVILFSCPSEKSKGGGHNDSAAVGGEDYLRSIRQFEEFVGKKP